MHVVNSVEGKFISFLSVLVDIIYSKSSEFHHAFVVTGKRRQMCRHDSPKPHHYKEPNDSMHFLCFVSPFLVNIHLGRMLPIYLLSATCLCLENARDLDFGRLSIEEWCC